MSSVLFFFYVTLAWSRMTSQVKAGEGGGGGQKRCQEITVPMCRGIGYNLTYMPNQFSHDTQDEAGLEVHQFWPLVEIQCSPDLRLFLCSMYTPICVLNYQKPLPACRSLCQRVRDGCEPLMIQYGFGWPERMNCDELPEYGDRQRLCMDFINATDSSAGNTGSDDRKNRLTVKPSHVIRQNNQFPVVSNPPPRVDATGSGNCSCACPSPLVHVTDESSSLFNRVSTGGKPNCAVPCRGLYFSADERTFIQFWIALWSSLCLASTAATVCTFAIDRHRFRYPERAIIFLSACYAFVALGYLLRLVLGHETVACDQLDAASTSSTSQIIRYMTTGPVACTSVFLLIYFFGMASCLWWVVLTFTWFLAAGLKWSQEAIAAHGQYFHLVAWLVPAVQTIVALAVSAVDGDPVSGICYVGNVDLTNLRGFVLGPLCAYLLTGTSFLLTGFVATFHIRRVIRRQPPTAVAPPNTDKLDRFMVRIGVVSVLYTVPASTVIACLFYEQHNRQSWERAFVCDSCSSAESSFQRAAGSQSTMSFLQHDDRPDFSVFALKYFACLVVGITSGFWIWTRKTLDSWTQFGRRLCPCGAAPGTGNKMAAGDVNMAAAAAGKPGAVGGGGCSRSLNPSMSLLTPQQQLYNNQQLQHSFALDSSKSPSLYSRV